MFQNSAKSIQVKVSEINESERVSNFKASTTSAMHTASDKIKTIGESDNIQNVKRRTSESWEKTCTKSGELAKKTKEEVLVPTWQKTCVATSAAVATAKPILSKTVEATKQNAQKASEKGSKVFNEDIKPSANKAGKAISTSVRRASLSASAMLS